MNKTKLLELRRELLDIVDRRTSTKEDLVAVIEEVANKLLQLYLSKRDLFELAKKLDEQIATLEAECKSYKERCELSDLKAYRAHVQEGIEADIASMETSMGM